MVNDKIYRHIIIMLVMVLCLGSCYEEQSLYPDRPEDVDATGETFHFTMYPEQEQMIYDKRGEKFAIDNPVPLLTFKDYEHQTDHFRIRGQSTLNFRRKSYTVKLDTPLNLYIYHEHASRDIEKFKLISLVYDYTYIENAIAIGIFRELGLWPLYSTYTEVAINGNTQGVYLFIEDPEDYFLYQQDAALMLRRGYHHAIDKYEANDEIMTEPPATYLDAFESIYDVIVEYSGEELYNRLSELMDIEQYFKKLAVDYWVQNGDATDEVFFYMQTRGDNVFGVYPWDYDDLFASQPHEVGRDWSAGTLFGERIYDSHEDVRAVTGDRFIWSIEDDLDYKIATDDYLYKKYEAELEKVMAQMDQAFIEQMIADIDTTLQPFYNDQAVIEQSQYDADSTNKELYRSNLENKKQFLLDRRAWILEQL